MEKAVYNAYIYNQSPDGMTSEHLTCLSTPMYHSCIVLAVLFTYILEFLFNIRPADLILDLQLRAIIRYADLKLPGANVYCIDKYKKTQSFLFALDLYCNNF